MQKKQAHSAGKELWLTLLLAIQPVLDALAYLMRNERATPAGYVRLLILVLFPVFVFFRTKEKKRFLLFLLAAGAYSLLHAWNSWRTGYLSPSFDLRYLVSVLQMPVFAVCFLLCIRDARMKDAALRGVAIAGALMLLFFFLAWLSDTGSDTYGPGMGYSGWVIEDNRNANSTVLVFLACICVFLALRSGNRTAGVAVSLTVDALLLANGTKGCYFSIFGIFGGLAVYEMLRPRLTGEKADRRLIALLLGLCVFSAAIYPVTPRYRVTEDQRKAAGDKQGEIEATLLEQGIDITDMTFEERFENPQVREVFEYYYWRYLGIKPDLIDRFGMDCILRYYKMSTDVGKLIDIRVMKRAYSDLIFRDSDFLTKLLGFEVTEVGTDGAYDLENDWHAIFYYYGYLGFTLYVGFILWFVYRVIRKLRRDGRTALTQENFTLGLCFVMMLGLAHFSGATLRRPNVSIWLSLLLGLLYYATEQGSGTDGNRLSSGMQRGGRTQ